MKFRPLHDRVVVTRIGPEAKSAGGIIIPDTAQEKPSQGEIIAVGPGGRDEDQHPIQALAAHSADHVPHTRFARAKFHSTCRIANIGPDDAMILAQAANPDGSNFRKGHPSGSSPDAPALLASASTLCGRPVDSCRD